ncbi:recombinase family protein [Pseudochrobactrum kiredjianiae]|uniref:Recombinase family protein n=1 Tax=Pseudochrobactrum kiredjianiae TaxID=386305 RepID=A0ABW3V1U5_9HYPH|nr:recombinase family protein [Pseudochrobactrum kiredjianiae]MDM7852505.1 recombinase family protein [Pseudochrobactrum kiredjianiae]
MNSYDKFRNHTSLNRPLRVAIYARFSTDKQHQQSIIDQNDICSDFAQSEGWEIVKFYHDEAICGSLLQLRTGIQHLLRDAMMGAFDIVLTEATDRLSRNQEYRVHIFNTLKYNRVRIQTLSEGMISEIHIRLIGTTNAKTNTQMGEKIFQGMRERVKIARWAGGPPPYGYKLARRSATTDLNNDNKGRLVIVPAAAKIVERIYKEYAAGHSPISIARRLNAEGIPSPSGKQWCDSTIRGHAKNSTGILNNECYNGLYIWNKHDFARNPYTDRRNRRINPRELWHMAAVPAWKIIDDDLYRAVRLRQAQVTQNNTKSIKKTQNSHEQMRLNASPRPHKLLLGLIRCGCCEGLYTPRSKKLFSCSSHERKGSCRNSRTVSGPMIEKHIYNSFKDMLNDKNALDAMFDAFEKEFRNLMDTDTSDGQHTRKLLEKVTREINAMVDEIKNGLCSDSLTAELVKQEQVKKDLEYQLETGLEVCSPHRDDILTHYQNAVADLFTFLKARSETHAASQLIRPLIDKVTVVPGLKRGEIELLFAGSITALPPFGTWQKFGGTGRKQI